MARLAALFALLGLAAATAIILRSGYGDILAALTAARGGILCVAAYHLVQLSFCVVGWRALIPRRRRPSFAFLLYALWLRSAVNNLMPVARIGGEVVCVRLMIRHGMLKSLAIASTVVELTLSIAAEFPFVLLGIFLLSLRAADSGLGWKLAAGLLASTPLLAALALVQRIGIFGILDKIFTLLLRGAWTKFAGDIGAVDRAIRQIYRRRRRLFFCFVFEFLSWCMGAGDIALSLYFLGHPIHFTDAFALEALIQGTASAGFAIPGALGVQEAGFLFFGRLLGLPPDIAVALAVMRRCRDLVLFLPGLVVWQLQEGRWLLSKPMK